MNPAAVVLGLLQTDISGGLGYTTVPIIINHFTTIQGHTIGILRQIMCTPLNVNVTTIQYVIIAFTRGGT
jgi:hypothetical protein